MFKIKLVVIGPCKGGKTTLSNFLADATETSGGEYFPTQGVRILEFESGALHVHGRNAIAEVELWDCSGNEKFDSCWPAITRDTHGVIFVYSADQSNYGRDLEKFYAHFVHLPGLRDSQCLVFALHKANSLSSSSTKHLPSQFGNMTIIEASIDEDGDGIRDEFNRYLQSLITGLHDRRDQEELNIINS